jgi:photosystem II stability/assembly factor-like uncharacterized protein
VTHALVGTSFGVFEIDLHDGTIEHAPERSLVGESADVALPLLVSAAEAGSRVVAVVARRPPLVLSDDSGLTWREVGGGLPAGRAVAIDPDRPDRMLFASESRIYVSEDGGRFWRVLEPELIGITAVEFS